MILLSILLNNNINNNLKKYKKIFKNISLLYVMSNNFKFLKFLVKL